VRSGTSVWVGGVLVASALKGGVVLARLCGCAVVVAALVAAPAAAGDGPMFVSQGGSGVLAASGGGGVGGLRFVAVGVPSVDRTLLEAVQASDGSVVRWVEVSGEWGVPTVGYGYNASAAGEGLAFDGRTLVLGSLQGPSSPSQFLALDPRRMVVVKRVSLSGLFSYDALSPDGSRLYLIQYLQSDLNHYVVRAYDLRAGRLLPGRIADRTQKSWVMQGSAVTRTTSAGGRWVYTLYQNPGGYPFIHALDTVRGVAHCVGLPLANQSGIYNLVLSLHGRTLAVHWRSGRRWLNLDTASWRLIPASGALPLPWIGLGAAGGLLTLSAAAVTIRRRREQELDSELQQLLGEPTADLTPGGALAGAHET
jgi:hypothetical protein